LELWPNLLKGDKMESHFPFKKLTPLENVMVNIQAEGKIEVWKSIEEINNPFERCVQRKLFREALDKIGEKI